MDSVLLTPFHLQSCGPVDTGIKVVIQDCLDSRVRIACRPQDFEIGLM